MRALSPWQPFVPERWPAGWAGQPLFRTSDTLATSQWVPPLDLVEHADSYEVTLELPGLTAADIDVNYERGTLVIRGEKRAAAGDDGERNGWRRIERSYGAFSRAVRIGGPVDHEAIAARFCDGVLSITLPKAAEAKRQSVTISS